MASDVTCVSDKYMVISLATKHTLILSMVHCEALLASSHVFPWGVCIWDSRLAMALTMMDASVIAESMLSEVIEQIFANPLVKFLQFTRGAVLTLLANRLGVYRSCLEPWRGTIEIMCTRQLETKKYKRKAMRLLVPYIIN